MMKYVLETTDLTKIYGYQKAVSHVNIHIEQGAIYGLIGKNGAGKSTLMKMICGLAAPTNGSMRMFDKDDFNAGRKRIGCMIEQPALYPFMTAKENLIYYNKLLGIKENSNVDELLNLVGLGDTGKKKTHKFSLGMQQRLAIAISLLGAPDFLVLDEPINGLDPMGIIEIRELILKLNHENNITIMISSHILGELSKVATKYGVISEGSLIEEFTTEELQERCKSCLRVVVDNMPKTTYLLDSILHSQNYKVIDEKTVYLYDHLDEKKMIVKFLSKITYL